jgi:hypothetical protein
MRATPTTIWDSDSLDHISLRVSTAQMLSTSVLALKQEYELNCQGKKNFQINLKTKDYLPQA